MSDKKELSRLEYINEKRKELEDKLLKKIPSEPQIKKKPFKLIGWYPIFYSVPKKESCAICRSELQSKCIYCISPNELNKCTYVEGVCGCLYHKHCIDKWLSSQNDSNKCCPTDFQKWKNVKEYDK